MPFFSDNSQLPLSKDEVQSFQEDGYLVKDFGLSSTLIESILEDVNFLYSEEFKANPTTPERAFNAWETQDSVKSLATQANILLALKQLYGRTALAFQTLNFPIGTSQKIHSDTIHFNSKPSGFMAGVWIALEDINENNGPLVYYPKSHKRPILSMSDLKLKGGRDNYQEYELAIEKLIEELELTPKLGIVKKGDAIIWHANLLHGGFPHKDVKQSRHSQVTHYFFQDCKYYTPLFFDDDKEIEYVLPTWINAEDYRAPNKLKKLWNKLT